MTDMDALMSRVARRLFTAALEQDRAGQLYNALISGGSATIDATDGQLVIIDADILAALVTGPGPALGALATDPGPDIDPVTLAKLAGYLRACWDYGVQRNGTVEVGVMATPYHVLFDRELAEAGLTPSRRLLDALHVHGVVVPSLSALGQAQRDGTLQP